MAFWLLKSEPSVFSVQDLQQRPQQTEPWDGVRNYQARNMLRDQMQVGDLAFFYHSNCETPGIVGIVEIVTPGYPDTTAFDPNHKYYDPKGTPEQPRWYRVDVRFVRELPRVVTLRELKLRAELSDLPLVQRGNRLSVMPVSVEAWQLILQLAASEPMKK